MQSASVNNATCPHPQDETKIYRILQNITKYIIKCIYILPQSSFLSYTSIHGSVHRKGLSSSTMPCVKGVWWCIPSCCSLLLQPIRGEHCSHVTNHSSPVQLHVPRPRRAARPRHLRQVRRVQPQLPSKHLANQKGGSWSRDQLSTNHSSPGTWSTCSACPGRTTGTLRPPGGSSLPGYITFNQ